MNSRNSGSNSPMATISSFFLMDFWSAGRDRFWHMGDASYEFPKHGDIILSPKRIEPMQVDRADPIVFFKKKNPATQDISPACIDPIGWFCNLLHVNDHISSHKTVSYTYLFNS